MRLPDEDTADLVRRLRRVEGQVRGLAAMLESGRDCREVATQFSAASRALRATGLHYLSRTVTRCLADPEAAEEEGYTPDLLERLFTGL